MPSLPTSGRLGPPPPLGEKRGCRFPLWADDGRPTGDPKKDFCGEPVTAPGKPYCLAHSSICHEPPRYIPPPTLKDRVAVRRSSEDPVGLDGEKA